MPRFGVAWGNTPDISGSMQSLGASLAGAVSGNPNSRAARDAAYMESLRHHNQVYDNQAAAIAAKMAADQEEADRKAQEFSTQQKAAGALGEAAAVAMPHPPLVLNPGDPAIVKYNTDTDAVRQAAPYVLQGGGNADARAKGFKEFYNPLPPAPVELGTGKSSKMQLNKNKDAYLKEGPNGPEWVPIKGQPVTNTNQEGLDAATRALDAYTGLEKGGGIGPYVGSETGRTLGHFFGTDNSKLREEYEAARSKLILMERQRLMRGQGAVSDKDAAQIENMFPKFNANDPQVGIRTLTEMKKRLSAGGSLLDAGTAQPEAAAPEFEEGAVAENPSTGERLVFKNGVWVPE